MDTAPWPLNFFLSFSWMISMSMMVYSTSWRGMHRLPNGLLKKVDALMSETGIVLGAMKQH